MLKFLTTHAFQTQISDFCQKNTQQNIILHSELYLTRNPNMGVYHGSPQIMEYSISLNCVDLSSIH